MSYTPLLFYYSLNNSIHGLVQGLLNAPMGHLRVSTCDFSIYSNLARLTILALTI